MSLDFNYSKVKDHDTVMFDEKDMMKPVSEVIIWRMMHTGIDWELTESNAGEFYARCKFLDALWGQLLIRPEGDSSLTPEEVQAHIGLHVNVAPETRSKFTKRVMENYFTEQMGEYKNVCRRASVDA